MVRQSAHLSNRQKHIYQPGTWMLGWMLRPEYAGSVRAVALLVLATCLGHLRTTLLLGASTGSMWRRSCCCRTFQAWDSSCLRHKIDQKEDGGDTVVV